MLDLQVGHDVSANHLLAIPLALIFGTGEYGLPVQTAINTDTSSYSTSAP